MPTLRPALFGTPWTGPECSRKRKKTQNPTQISVLFLCRRNGDPGHGVLFGQGEVPAWEWGAHELSSQARDGAPSCRTPRPTRRHDAGPAFRARVAGYLAATLALKAGPGPLPRHARSWNGAGQPMASASPGGERATLPGAVLAVGGPVLCAVTLKPRPCGGRMPPHLRHGWRLPGWTRARRSLRPRLPSRAGGGASRADGPLFAGHARANRTDQASSRGGGLFCPRPWPALASPLPPSNPAGWRSHQTGLLRPRTGRAVTGT